MQDEINEKTIVLAIKGAKLSGRFLPYAQQKLFYPSFRFTVCNSDMSVC